MDSIILADFSLPDNVLVPLLESSNSSNLNGALEQLIYAAKTSDGRLRLATKSIIQPVLQLCQALPIPSCQHLLLLSLKLLRNLCAGEIRNQNLFIEQNGVEIVSAVASSLGSAHGSGLEILPMVLQVVGNVSLAGEEHQDAVWHQFFPLEFLQIARLRSKETCDPLCMVIHTCSAGCSRRFTDLCMDPGVDIVIEIIRTVTLAGFDNDWLKIILSRICLEGHCLSAIFSKLSPANVAESGDYNASSRNQFGPEQAYLLSLLSEILNKQLENIVVSCDSALCVLEILRNAVGIVEFTTRGKSGLPTGNADIDVIGYSLTILRDICACDNTRGSNNGEKDVVDMLVSAGLVQLLVSLLHDLELPPMIQKTMTQSKAKDAETLNRAIFCPYRGFRRDLVAVIGNCAYHRSHVQDKIREHNGILLLLQQSVTDEDNPFLREWGIWSMRNILGGNSENQKLVSNLEFQGSPEVEQMGFRVEVDPHTRRAKLVNL